MRVPIYERREGISPLQGGNVSPVMPAGDNGASAAGVVKGLALRLQQMQDDTEDARTLELFNKFKNDSMEYHENPDKGIYNTRLWYQSQGVFSEADEWLRQRGESYVNQLRGERSKANFRRMARDYIVQRGTQNSRFEAAQMKKYQTEQAEATYKNGINDIALNPYDDDYVNNARQGIIDALELKLRGASPEVRSLALAGMEDDIAVARFSAMFNNNPAKANEWYNKNADSFSAQNKQKFTKALEGYRVQSIVDELVRIFPQGQEQEALKHIRKNFNGDREERIVSAYKTRANELAIKEANQEQILRQQQNDLRDTILKEFYLTGSMPSSEELRQLVASNQLSYSHAEQIETRQNNAAKRSIIENQILKKTPNLTQLELDREVMRQMGTTQEEYQNALFYALNAYMSKELDEQGLKGLRDRGLLPTADIKRIKDYVGKFDDTQKNIYKIIEKDFDPVKKDSLISKIIANGFPAELAQGVRSAFIDAAIYLDPRSKTYRQDLLDLQKKTLLDAMDNSGKDKKTWAFFGTNPIFMGMFGEKNTNFGEVYEEIKGQKLEKRNIQPEPTIPEFIPLDLALETNSGVLGTSNNLALNMVKGGKITGRFSDWRAYRNGQHNGIDVAAPEGTDIVLEDFKTPLTVTKVGLGSKTAGNYVILNGTYGNGDSIELQINHMKDGSINIKKDDILDAGAIIGQVGKTGHATGAHMDLKIKINGKYVDPETFTPPASNSQKQTTNNTEKKSLDAIFGLASIFRY